MDAGLVVVLAATGVFLLVPLVFAWLSTNPRRWSRVEGVLGRDLPNRERPPRWVPVAWAGQGIIYVALGLVRLRSDRPSDVGWLIVAQGALFMALGAAVHLVNRRLRRTAASVQSQVEDRAEPGRPRLGG